MGDYRVVIANKRMFFGIVLEMESQIVEWSESLLGNVGWDVDFLPDSQGGIRAE